MSTEEDERIDNMEENYFEEFNEMNEEEIIRQTERISEAFNVYHMLKNVRRSSRFILKK